MIPILDLKLQYEVLKAEIDEAVQRVLRSGIFIMGPNVEAFEGELASYLGVRHAISVNSGTDALHLALRALDIGPGDEVITSPFTFAATTEAIGMIGATPIFCDIELATFNIDASLIEAAITPRTRAILPIHLYGAAADLPRIHQIARKHKLAVVEDCAQAIGTEISGEKVGSRSDVGCFSFFPTKNLGAYGDGGLITTNDDQIAQRLKGLRVHGGRRKYYHEELGVNSRLDEIQAAILRVKLPYLNSWIGSRRERALRYGALFSGNGAIVAPVEPKDSLHTYHQYTIRVGERDAVRSRLSSAGVQSMVYYPVPLHLQAVNKSLNVARGTLPKSEEAAQTVLSLPMYPELSAESQTLVARALLASLQDSVPA